MKGCSIELVVRRAEKNQDYEALFEMLLWRHVDALTGEPSQRKFLLTLAHGISELITCIFELSASRAKTKIIKKCIDHFLFALCQSFVK